jgi:hypothetical protein
MELTSLACLFVSKTGCFAVRLIEPPLQAVYEEPPVPPGMRHAVRLLGLESTIRTYKRTVDGELPVYEEI